MAIEANIPFGSLFTGTAPVLSFEVFAANDDPDYDPTTDAHAVMQNVTGWTFEWALCRAVGMAPHRTRGVEIVSKVSGDGISIVGTYNVDRAVNTQRVEVPLARADTVAAAGGACVHTLNRIDVGLEAVVSYGTAPLLVSAVP